MALEIDARGLMTIFSNSGEETQLAKLFSGEAAVKTPDQSLLFIKKIVAIAASNVLYLRNAFPDDAFKKFKCDGSMELNLLCPIQSSNKTNAVGFIKNLLSVLGGIEKQYVEKLDIYIVYRDGDGTAVTEIYTFHFEYNDDIKVTFSKDNITEVNAIYTKDSKQLIGNTRGILRQIQVLCTTSTLIPEDANPKVNMHVTYTSNIPENYHLPGFVAAKFDLPSGTERENLWLGHVSTPYHLMKLEHKAIEGVRIFSR